MSALPFVVIVLVPKRGEHPPCSATHVQAPATTTPAATKTGPARRPRRAAEQLNSALQHLRNAKDVHPKMSLRAVMNSSEIGTVSGGA